MAKQKDIDTVHIQIAKRYATLSKAVRLKVGAVVVTQSGVVIPGFNGTPSGFDNECEITNEDGTLTTKDNVIHAELNCILKAAKEGVSVSRGTMYLTHAPCERCAALIVQSDIRRVVFNEHYRDTKGVDTLEEGGVSCEKFVEPKVRNRQHKRELKRKEAESAAQQRSDSLFHSGDSGIG